MIKEVECWLAVRDFNTDSIISARQHPISMNCIAVEFSCPQCRAICSLSFNNLNTVNSASWTANKEKTHVVCESLVWCYQFPRDITRNSECGAGMVLTLPISTYKVQGDQCDVAYIHSV